MHTPDPARHIPGAGAAGARGTVGGGTGVPCDPWTRQTTVHGADHGNTRHANTGHRATRSTRTRLWLDSQADSRSATAASAKCATSLAAPGPLSHSPPFASSWSILCCKAPAGSSHPVRALAAPGRVPKTGPGPLWQRLPRMSPRIEWSAARGVPPRRVASRRPPGQGGLRDDGPRARRYGDPRDVGNPRQR